MVDAFVELVEELDVIDALIAQVRGVVVEAEAFVPFDRVDRALRGDDVECDFGGVDFEREVDVFFFKRIQDRPKAFAKVGIALVEIRLVGRGEGVERVPDGGASKAVDDAGEVVAFRPAFFTRDPV